MGPSAVLIIEDSPFQANILRKQIQSRAPFEVLVAHTLAEARHILQTRSGDLFLAVVDLNLPDSPNGESADLCLDWKVPSLVLTANFDASLRTRFVERRVVDYFFKGSIRDMQGVLQSVLRIYKNQFITVLLADDMASHRNLMRDLLHVQRLNVVEAEDGVDALQALEECPEVRLVITDYQMPRMDGLDLVRELRARYPHDKLGIIGVSAVNSGPLTAQFLKLGANDYLHKPFEVEEFYWRVNQTLETMEASAPIPDSALGWPGV